MSVLNNVCRLSHTHSNFLGAESGGKSSDHSYSYPLYLY